MSLQNDTEPLSNSGYGSADETASLLMITNSNTNTNATTTTNVLPSDRIRHKLTSHSSINGPTPTTTSGATININNNNNNMNNNNNNKPVLIRQDRTSSYLVSPQLSHTGMGGSEESAGGGGAGAGGAGGGVISTINPNPNTDDTINNTRSVPDIEMHCRIEAPIISVSNSCHTVEHRGSVSGYGYQLVPYNKCRTCRTTCDRRASTTPTLQLARSVSKESVRGVFPGQISPNLAMKSSPIPVLVTSSPTSGSRIIRQSSQPEASTIICCGGHCVHAHSNTAPSVSLRQLREPGDGIAGIAADSLRINGAMRPFKQVFSVFICLSLKNSYSI